jgi:hypothetical protein
MPNYAPLAGLSQGLSSGLQKYLALQALMADREHQREREQVTDKRQAAHDQQSALANRAALAQSGVRQGAPVLGGDLSALRALSAVPGLSNAGALRDHRQVPLDEGHYLDLDETPSGREEHAAENQRSYAALNAIESANRERTEWDRRFGVESQQRLREIEAQGRNTIAAAGARTAGGEPTRDRSAGMQLAGMFNGEQTVKDANTVSAAFRKVRQHATSNTAAGDMGLIFGYMKILDPGSTVREGEYATAQNAASIPERVRNAYNRSIDGPFLTPEQRTRFVAEAETALRAQRDTFRPVFDRYRRMAESGGIAMDGVLYNPFEEMEATPAGGALCVPAPPAAQGGDPTQARVDAMIRAGKSDAEIAAALRGGR